MSRARCWAAASLLVLLWPWLAGCIKESSSEAEATPAPPAATRLRILATFAPVYCLTKRVAGDLADVEMLVPENINAAAFKPSEADLKKISAADVVIESGFGYERWLDALVPAVLKPGAIRIVAARGIPPLHASAPAAASLLLPPNPYVWLDPLSAITELQTIRDGLMQRDPSNSDEFVQNENRYEALLRDLDTEVGQATVDLSRRRLLCLSDTFAYFLKRYEFAAEAGKAARPQAVLATPGEAAFARSISNENSLPLVILDPMETGPASADFYEKTTRANAAAMREALK